MVGNLRNDDDASILIASDLRRKIRICDTWAFGRKKARSIADTG